MRNADDPEEEIIKLLRAIKKQKNFGEKPVLF